MKQKTKPTQHTFSIQQNCFVIFMCASVCKWQLTYCVNGYQISVHWFFCSFHLKCYFFEVSHLQCCIDPHCKLIYLQYLRQIKMFIEIKSPTPSQTAKTPKRIQTQKNRLHKLSGRNAIFFCSFTFQSCQIVLLCVFPV